MNEGRIEQLEALLEAAKKSVESLSLENSALHHQLADIQATAGKQRSSSLHAWGPLNRQLAEILRDEESMRRLHCRTGRDVISHVT